MKPEGRFIEGVHDVLHQDIYREKMFNPLRGGTPDCYYMGFAGELWIEYKFAKTIPKIIRAAPGKTKGMLTSLQHAWLMRAHDRSKDPWVVVGSPTGCIVLRGPAEWREIARDKAQVLSKQELARRIEDRCGLEFSGAPPSARSSSTP